MLNREAICTFFMPESLFTDAFLLKSLDFVLCKAFWLLTALEIFIDNTISFTLD